MDVLALLESKNRCLEKMRQASEEFLSSSKPGDLAGLDDFESKRNSIFKAIDLYDRKVTELAQERQRQSQPLSREEREGIQKELWACEQILLDIQTIDQKIMQVLSSEAEILTREIQSLRKGRDLISRFKSDKSSPSGTEIDHSL